MRIVWMVASLYSSCVLGCRHERVWAVRRGVETVGAGSCAHSWLICITSFNHLYSEMVDVCGLLGRVNLYEDDDCEGVVVVSRGLDSVCREDRVDGRMAGGMTKVFSGMEARSA